MSLKVNGQTYSWGDVDVKIPGLVLVVQEISYDDEQDMISVYAVLVKNSKRDIESLPEEYIIPVAEYLAAQEEGTLEPEE